MVFSGDWDFFNKWQKEGGKGKCLVLVNAKEKENEAEEEKKDRLIDNLNFIYKILFE